MHFLLISAHLVPVQSWFFSLFFRATEQWPFFDKPNHFRMILFSIKTKQPWSVHYFAVQSVKLNDVVHSFVVVLSDQLVFFFWCIFFFLIQQNVSVLNIFCNLYVPSFRFIALFVFSLNIFFVCIWMFFFFGSGPFVYNIINTLQLSVLFIHSTWIVARLLIRKTFLSFSYWFFPQCSNKWSFLSVLPSLVLTCLFHLSFLPLTAQID